MTLPTLEKLAALRKLAEAACDAEVESVSDDAAALQDFRHTFTPTTVLSLLDALEAQRVELEGLRGALRGHVASTLAEIDAYLDSPLKTEDKFR